MFSAGFRVSLRHGSRLAAAAACALLLWTQLAVALHDHAGSGDPHGPGDRALACDFCLGHAQVGAPPPAAPSVDRQDPVATLLPPDSRGVQVRTALLNANGPRGPPSLLSATH